MSADLLTPETITVEQVRDLFDAALMDATLDADNGSVVVRDDIIVRAKLSESKERLLFITYYGLKEEAQRIDRLELVNRINDQYILVRASVSDDDDLCLDYSLPVKGGTTKRQIAHALRAFITVSHKAVVECDEDGIVE